MTPIINKYLLNKFSVPISDLTLKIDKLILSLVKTKIQIPEQSALERKTIKEIEFLIKKLDEIKPIPGQ